MRPNAVALVLVLLVLSLTGGCAGAEPSPSAPPGAATVVAPIDGDTIVVEVGGAEEHVRFIGIDTPETVAPDRPVECFGPEASARTESLLPVGTDVVLERDVEARDRYGRLLAYIIRAEDGMLVNLQLVEEGMAEASSYPPNTARDRDLAQAEARARGARLGLWGACG
jgi:micrococcal nuclease